MNLCSVRRAAGALALALVALPMALTAQAPTGTVRGRVTDASSGRGLPDAQVVVTGTRAGALTNASGEYTITAVPTGPRSITVRRIGYLPATRAVTVVAGGTATADFAVNQSAINLSEVVVTGTAAPTEKRRVGTSIASVDTASLAKAAPVTIDQALQGKVAGAQITQNSGGPGGGGISIRLRGTGSLISGSDPLYVVDGVIIDNGSAQLVDLGARANPQNRLADLNPADIERVEIIRGAAAAALYGSRASNGVVQIFTKRGTIGKPRVSFTTRYGSNELREKQPFNLYPFDVNGVPIARYDHQDDIFRRAPSFENIVTVDGGTDQTRYYVSGSMLDEDGIIRSTSSSRRSLRVNLQQQLATTLTANVNANYVNTRNQLQGFGEQNSYGIMGSLFFAPTNVDFRPVNGVYPLPPSLGTNPLLAIDRIRNPQNIDRFLGSVRLNWTPSENWFFDYVLGLDNSTLTQEQFIPRNAVLGGVEITGQALSSVLGTRTIDQNFTGRYTWPRVGRMEFTTIGGFNYTDQLFKTTLARSNGLAPVGELVGAGSVFAAGASEFQLRTLGFFATQEFGWANKLFLNAAIRYDGASTFAPSERFQWFPKFSGSYVARENKAGWFNSLRLRGAWGEAGLQPGAAFAYAQFNQYTQTPFAGRPGFVNDVVRGNPTLRNERTREWEVGTDWGFLNGRLGIEASYYDRLAKDVLFFRPLATSTGFTNQFAPIGRISNTGLELLVRTVNVDRPNFRWESTINYSRNRNNVESLSIPEFQSATGYPNRIMVGRPLGVFYGSYAARNCQTGALLLDSLGRYRRSNQRPADLPTNAAQLTALSGGSCNDSLQKVIGDPNPDFIGGILNEFTIARKLRVRVLFDGVFGNDVMNLSTRAQNAGIASNSAEFQRELLPYGDPRKLPPGFNARTQGIFEYWVEDGSFVKLRELSASYTIDWAPVKRLFRDGIDVTLAGRNLFVWTNYSGYDPELNLFGTNAGTLTTGRPTTTAADRGFDFGGFPIPRTWTLSARFTY
jgi:TonB-dependent SusC/RagA subfamily outer membrane receptor